MKLLSAHLYDPVNNIVLIHGVLSHPRTDSISQGINVSHPADLLTLLNLIILIDANSISLEVEIF